MPKPHPPIPPNREYFSEETGIAYIYFKYIGCGEYHQIETADKDIKAIIAAVARCAWLDEAMAIYNSNQSLTWDVARDGKQALENAEAWAQWGRGDD